MKAFQWSQRKKDPIPPPGDDVVPVPPPVTEEPPHDRFCDLVLTGGVASGVVYPWAIVELARKYRFRNIGGTSVGAMAAALAAAAEYGRRTGYEAPFEALRRAPASLGFKYTDGRTRMLSLFQTNPQGRRLIWLWGKIFCGNRNTAQESKSRAKGWDLTARWRWLLRGGKHPAEEWEQRFTPRGTKCRSVMLTIVAYWAPLLVGAAIGVDLACLLPGLRLQGYAAWLIPAFFALVCAVVGLLAALWYDIRYGVIENSYGLCKGGNMDGKNGPPGISQWLHDGIQASAGLGDDDPPLTFRDLWTAPDYPGAERKTCGRDDPPRQRSINLQVLTTNVTHGRPYRLPMVDNTSRLFFLPEELKDYFPPCVLRALVESSKPYAPSDRGNGSDPSPREQTAVGLFELPAEDLPVVVAARLSLSFPLLFSAVPLWAIDYEAPRGARTLRRCMFTDGGASSNFPIHLFDAAVPRWPTFGLWLDERGPYRRVERDKRKDPDKKIDPKDLPEQEVWLPEYNGQGYGDSWNRFDRESRAVEPCPKPDAPDPERAFWPAHPIPSREKSPYARLFGFLTGIAISATNWRDRTNFRMPHIRNRVARLLLLPREGGLHIGMNSKQILEMAHRYGTTTGLKLIERFADREGQPSRAWKEQRWIRFNLLVNGLRDMLDGLSTSAAWSTRTVPLELAIHAATQNPGPVEGRKNCQKIDGPQAEALRRLLDDLERFAGELQETPKVFNGSPEPELRLSARL